MRLLRYGPPGAERAGALDAQGRIRDLSLLIPDITPEWLMPERLKAIAAIDLEKMPLAGENLRFGVPVLGIRQFIGIGLNYRKHAEEAGFPIPIEPVVFNKAITALSGADDDIVLPEGSEETDWEIELGLVIGTVARKVPIERALEYVAGYCLANDVSERNWQIKRNGQWTKGKSFDTFGPLGPWLVTSDEILDPQNLDMELRINGTVRQRGHTSDMIFPVSKIISHLSQFMTLLPGDVVVTGTPSGVGLGSKPPEFLKRGDVISMQIQHLGSQTHRVV